MALCLTVNALTCDLCAVNIYTDVGVLNSGDVNSTFDFNDDDNYNISEVVGSPGSIIRFNVTGLSNGMFNLSMRQFYDGNPAHIIDINLFNTSSGGYDTIGTITEGSFNWFNYTTITGSNYINSGVLEVEINHTSSGNTNHLYHIDYVDVDVQTTTTSTTTILTVQIVPTFIIEQVSLLDRIRQILEDIYLWITRQTPTYNIQISNDTQFNYTVIDKHTVNSDYKIDIDHILNRAGGNDFYWRVRYAKDGVLGAWSETRYLNISS